jgi:glycosyltransferase involved in cell wall biosynthesis
VAKIAVVSARTGGDEDAERLAAQEATILMSEGHEVRWFTPDGAGIPDGTPAVAVGSGWQLVSDAWFSRADLAVFHLDQRYPLYDAMVLAPTMHPRSVVRAHRVGTNGDGGGNRDALELARRADRIWTTSAHDRRLLVERGFPPGTIDVVEPGVSLDPVRRPVVRRGPIRVLSRQACAEGFELVLDALAAVNGRLRGAWLLYLVGEPVSEGSPARAELARLRDEHDLSAHVQLCGVPRHEEIQVMYRAMDVVIVGSPESTSPIGAIEALAAGCVVAGAPREELVVNGRPLTGEANAATLAMRLEELVIALQARARGREPEIPTAVGLLPLGDYRRLARQHIGRYRPQALAARLRGAVRRVLDP